MASNDTEPVRAAQGSQQTTAASPAKTPGVASGDGSKAVGIPAARPSQSASATAAGKTSPKQVSTLLKTYINDQYFVSVHTDMQTYIHMSICVYECTHLCGGHYVYE